MPEQSADSRDVAAGLQGQPALPTDGDCGAMLHRLYHYLDGELTVERRQVIQMHLDGCPSCFSAYDFEAELRLVITERVRARVPAELVDRIRRSLSSADEA